MTTVSLKPKRKAKKRKPSPGVMWFPSGTIIYVTLEAGTYKVGSSRTCTVMQKVEE